MRREDMKFLPISLNITNKKILIIGGGNVALHKLKNTWKFTRDITVLGKQISDDIKIYKLNTIEKAYEKADLKDYYVVFACTNIEALNRQIYNDCHAMHKLVCVVDNPPLADFVSPAIYKRKHMTVSVGSNAQDVRQSIKLRNHIKSLLDNNNAGLI